MWGYRSLTMCHAHSLLYQLAPLDQDEYLRVLELFRRKIKRSGLKVLREHIYFMCPGLCTTWPNIDHIKWTGVNTLFFVLFHKYANIHSSNPSKFEIFTCVQGWIVEKNFVSVVLSFFSPSCFPPAMTRNQRDGYRVPWQIFECSERTDWRLGYVSIA